MFSIFFIGCKKETEELTVNDYLTYYDNRVAFSDHYYYNNGDNTATILTTVSLPDDLHVIDYGHCWIDQNGVPTIADNKTSFGQTNLKNFTISSTIQNYSFWSTYYGRAYIKTEGGIIYDLTYTF
jgi:hypothetical protein